MNTKMRGWAIAVFLVIAPLVSFGGYNTAWDIGLLHGPTNAFTAEYQENSSGYVVGGPNRTVWEAASPNLIEDIVRHGGKTVIWWTVMVYAGCSILFFAPVSYKMIRNS